MSKYTKRNIIVIIAGTLVLCTAFCAISLYIAPSDRLTPASPPQPAVDTTQWVKDYQQYADDNFKCCIDQIVVTAGTGTVLVSGTLAEDKAAWQAVANSMAASYQRETGGCLLSASFWVNEERVETYTNSCR